MNFKYVDVSNIDPQEPILPNVAGWENLSAYPLNAIDPAFLMEATIERFIDSSRIPAEFTPGDDDVAYKVLRAQPLLRIYNAIQTRAHVKGVSQLFINTLPIVDKEGESQPSYVEHFGEIETVSTGDSFITGRPFVLQDVKDLYVDLRKFKRKNLYFNTNTDHVDYRYENNTPIPSIGIMGSFGWYHDLNGNQNRYWLTPTDSYGLYLEPRNVLENQFQNLYVCNNYQIMRVAVSSAGRIVLNEEYYVNEWQETSMYKPATMDELISRIPNAWYSISKSQNMIEKAWTGWSVPQDYEYEEGGVTKHAYKTMCVVNYYPRYLFGDLKLTTTY